MKKLTTAACLVCLAVFFTATAFKPEASNDKKQVVQVNYRPVLLNCLTPAGQVYAFRNSCVVSAGDVCVATLCPGAPVQANRRPVIINCVRNGLLYAFANNCVVQNGSVCRPTACP